MAEDFSEYLDKKLEEISPSNYLDTLDRGRPYEGQPHTDLGERGKTEVKGITFRDLRDCFFRAAFAGSGLLPEEYPKSIYDLPWGELDPIAVQQNLTCWVEKYMGIYPNVPELIEDNNDGREQDGNSGVQT